MIELYSQNDLLVKMLPDSEYGNLPTDIKDQFPLEGSFAWAHVGEWWPSEDGTKEYRVIKVVTNGIAAAKDFDRPSIRIMVDYSHFASLYTSYDTRSKAGHEIQYKGLKGLMALIAKCPPAENGSLTVEGLPTLYYKKFNDQVFLLEHWEGDASYAYRHNHTFNDRGKFNAYGNLFGSK
jgi:hypothetical protein